MLLTRKLLLPAVSLLTAHVVSHAQQDNALHVTADTPEIEVESRVAGRSFISLPSLSYALEVTQTCDAGLAPTSLSLSVADTRRTFGAEDLSEHALLTLDLTIPAGQIGPIALADFCISVTDTENEAGDRERRSNDKLRIPAVLSLQAALLCASESESRMVYASHSLDVALNCSGDTAAAVNSSR